MNMSYHPLSGTKPELIHQAFTASFSDYHVPVDLTFEEFMHDPIKRRDVNFNLSLGMFKNGTLTGFVLNGIRNVKGIPTAYDSGTGVLPEYRSSGLGKELMKRNIDFLKEKGIERYVLEVITQNGPALSMYRKLGFRETRTLKCFKRKKFTLQETGKPSGLEETSAETIPWSRLDDFADHSPTWQNSREAILAEPASYCTVVLKKGDILAGFGMISREKGDIPMLAVHRKFRNWGLGRSIFNQLSKITRASNISVINVDNKNKGLCDILLANGFENHVDQVEMELPI